MTENVEETEGKKPWYKKWWVWVIAAVVVIGAGQSIGGKEEAPKAEKPAAEAPATEKEEPAEEHVAEPAEEPEEKESKFSFDSYELDGALNVDVRFEIADNFTKKMIASGAKTDTLAALQEALELYPELETVWVFGSFPTTDKYGNDEVSDILQVLYKRDTLDKINFANIDDQGIWDLRDGGLMNEGLQG